MKSEKTKSIKKKIISKKIKTNTTKKAKDIKKSAQQNEPKSKNKLRKFVKGWLGHFFVESIQIDNFPIFLYYDKDSTEISTTNQLQHDDVVFVPYGKSDSGYDVYSFSEKEINNLIHKDITVESILDQLKQVVDTYIDADSITKCLIQIDLLLTYCQEWISTTHFPFFVGETESGKSTALHLFKILAYRCLYGVNLPAANIYNFLGTEEEGTGTIAEDEAQEIWKDGEKLRLYKSSYAKGDLQARMLMFQNFKKQVYYRTFCFKLFAGERVVYDKGFVERLAIVNMIQGEPKANIKLASNEDVTQLKKLRNLMLIWKLQNLEKGLPLLHEIKLKGRDEELWSNFLKLSQNTKYFEIAIKTVEYFVEKRHSEISNSLEARIFGAMLNYLNAENKIDFEEFWLKISTHQEPDIQVIQENMGQTFSDADTGEKITRPSISKILKEKFHGKKIPIVETDEGFNRRKTYYRFDIEELKKLAKKYNKPFQTSIATL
ncbi:hypothetical protein NMT12_120098 [metagenome]